MPEKKSTKRSTKQKIGGENKTVAVNPTQEYLTGGVMSGFSSQLQALTPDSDEIMRDVSPFAYDQMICDPEISKCITILKIAILNDGVELIPALPENDPNYEAAVFVTNFCNAALRSLEKPLGDTLWQMMDALIYGHKIAEITYKTGELLGFPGISLTPAKIKVKNRDIVRFVVDDKGNVIGLIGKLAKDNDLSKTNSPAEPLKVSFDPTSKTPLINGSPILPREKFMVLTVNPRNDDPRGRSLLRPAFNVWRIKVDIWPEYLRYLLMCATPLLVGILPDSEPSKEFLYDASGNIVKDSQGRYVEISPVAAMRDALVQARNATGLALKGGSKLQEVGGQGAGTPFYKAIEILDKQMESAILLQTLATSEGIHQNRSAAQTHMSVLDLLVFGLKRIVIDMLVSDLLRPIVKFNFGDNALELVPKISLGDSERHSFSEDALAVATLYKAGYFQADQLKAMDALLSVPVRETVDPQLLIQQLQAAGIPILAVPPPPTHEAHVQAGPGGGNTPIPINPSSTATKTGNRVDSEQQLLSKERISRGNKFPALGRANPKINKGNKNSETNNNVNKKP